MTAIVGMPNSASGDPSVIRALIVTEVSLFREGLSRILASRDDLQIVGSAASANDVLNSVRTQRPDVVLIDATTLRASELVARLKEAVPDSRVVALAIDHEDEEEVLACAEAGVAGYVARSATVDELVAVLHSAVHGEMRCPPQVTTTIFRQIARLAPVRAVAINQPEFTRREIEIASLLEHRLTNKEIAHRLGIEVATVKNHIHNILEKLHVRRRVDVASLLNSRTRWRVPASLRPSGI